MWDRVHNTEDEEELISFERKVLRKMHGPVWNQSGEYKRRKIDDLESLYNQINIRLFQKPKRLEWAEENLMGNVLIRNSEIQQKVTKGKDGGWTRRGREYIKYQQIYINEYYDEG